MPARTQPHPWIRTALSLALTLVLAACSGYPRDADDMTQRADEQGMRVGASHDPPWVLVAPDGRVSGPEPELLQRYADARGYRLEWVPGGHDALMRDLERAHLHAVVGGHHRTSPWKPRVGWSQPLRARPGGDAPLPERRIALPPGQSAWHLAFDSFLVQHGDRR
ncbi:transporter substrate-binding domain-containing protein [Luteimonas kalidii]|uniref:ABC transporter substrate-binding protein n=1 Tax=Luteimonas kalidii TaxID=3042025 RepID=A0ABT6JW69_9GAMM|nr:ABC transporter substrate-binding protein [Luteimonas kalidii]MDH5834839.1 ABC transporter substrate-binding protein [Luteimonas kalidii]